MSSQEKEESKLKDPNKKKDLRAFQILYYSFFIIKFSFNIIILLVLFTIIPKLEFTVIQVILIYAPYLFIIIIIIVILEIINSTYELYKMVLSYRIKHSTGS